MSEHPPAALSQPFPAEWSAGGVPIVILNPAGGRGAARKLRGPIERALAGGRGELIVTRVPGEAAKLAEDAARTGRDVVVVGGDGTLNEAACGILASGRPAQLGIVPAGTGNDYAYETLKLPRDPLQALEVALTRHAHAMDVGEVNGRYFLNSLGVGIDANIAAAAEHLKRLPGMRGKTLYWTASLSEILFHYNRCPRLTVSYDGQVVPSRLFALAAVSIGPTYGGGFRINPGADPTDGYFDLCSITKPPWLRALRLLPLVEKGQHLDQPEVSRQRVRHVLLEARQPIHAHLDGEVITGQRFEARILPAALQVRRP